MIDEYRANAVRLLKDPDDAQALVNQFVLTCGKPLPSHIAMTARAVANAPEAFEALFNHASALNRAGEYKESLRFFLRALVACPFERRAECTYNIGMAFHDLGKLSEAIAWYDNSLQLRDDREVWQARAVARLAGGHLAEGLFDHEVKWHKPARKPIAESGIPRWWGEPLEGKRIIVAHEQGYGDTLQFIRFLPRLKAGKVTLSAPPELLTLLQSNVKADEYVDESGPFTADYYCSPMSMAACLGIEYAGIDGKPYLSAEPMTLPKRGRLKVGLSWKGSPGYARDALRSMALTDLLPILDLPGAAFYSLQVRPNAVEVSNLGLDGLIADLGSTLTGWHDTARAIAAMDVVISTDTANAHLAGALGKPVLLMLPYAACWRWLRNRGDTPWYRSVRLFRQSEPNKWPIARVRAALKEML